MKRLFCLFLCLFLCTPVVSYGNDDQCVKIIPRGNPESSLCRDKRENEPCSSKSAGIKVGRCQYNGTTTLSCTAKECNDGYLLWLTTKRNNSVQSQGRCWKESELIKFCKTGNAGKSACDCEPDERCERTDPIFFTAPGKDPKGNPYNRTLAFIGEDTCHCTKKTCEELHDGDPAAIDCCNAIKNGADVEWIDGVCKCNDAEKEWKNGQCVAKPKPVESKPEPVQPVIEAEIDCVLTYTGRLDCPDGSTKYINASYNIKDESELMSIIHETTGFECPDLGTVTQDQWTQFVTHDQIKDFFIKKNCPSKNNNQTVVIQQQAQEDPVLTAKRTLNAFFASISKSKWKTVDGNFNTARLVSDLGAGVVLGTVGGVVSGLVIKKKQLEKGFDALHCAVGGQKIADWGDTFTVELNNNR